MSSEIKKLFKNVIIDTLVTYILVAIVGAILCFISTYLFAKTEIVLKINQIHLMTLFIIIISAVLIIYIMYSLRLNKLATMAWDYTVHSDKETFVFDDREKCLLKSTFSIKVFKNGSLAYYESSYEWSGSKSELTMERNRYFELEILSRDSVEIKYRVKPKQVLTKTKKDYSYTLCFSLEDKHHTMHPLWVHSIRRPTEILEMELLISKNIDIRDVETIHQNMYSDNVGLKAPKMSEDEYVFDGKPYHRYQLKEKQTALVTRYGFQWEWEPMVKD